MNETTNVSLSINHCRHCCPCWFHYVTCCGTWVSACICACVQIHMYAFYINGALEALLLLWLAGCCLPSSSNSPKSSASLWPIDDDDDDDPVPSEMSWNESYGRLFLWLSIHLSQRRLDYCMCYCSSVDLPVLGTRPTRASVAACMLLVPSVATAAVLFAGRRRER